MSGGAQETPPVESAEPEVSQPEITEHDLEFVPPNVQDKAVAKVTELADSLGRICADGGQEIEGSRNFVQDLRGKWTGWRVTVDVRMTVRRSPD